MSIAAIGAIWLRLFLYPKAMRKVIHKVWGVPHVAIKVATCSSSGVYVNYTHNQRKKK